jgi:hypothetical protein
VLCDIMNPYGWVYDDHWRHEGSRNSLPPAIVERAGLDGCDPLKGILSLMNDCGEHDFKAIANYIEEHL